MRRINSSHSMCVLDLRRCETLSGNPDTHPPSCLHKQEETPCYRPMCSPSERISWPPQLRLSDNLPRFFRAPLVRMDAAANFPSRSSSRFRCPCASGDVAFALSASAHIGAAISSIARYLAIFPRFVAIRTSVNSSAAFAFPRRRCSLHPLFC